MITRETQAQVTESGGERPDQLLVISVSGSDQGVITETPKTKHQKKEGKGLEMTGNIVVKSNWGSRSCNGERWCDRAPIEKRQEMK